MQKVLLFSLYLKSKFMSIVLNGFGKFGVILVSLAKKLSFSD